MTPPEDERARIMRAFEWALGLAAMGWVVLALMLAGLALVIVLRG